MGLWESTRHIRTITVMATIITVMVTTVRLAAPMAPTERGALDHMGAQSSADPISRNKNCGAAARKTAAGIEALASIFAILTVTLDTLGCAKC